MIINTEDYVTLQEASSICGVQPERLRQYVRTKRLDAVKVGSIWLVKKTAAQSFKPKPIGRPPRVAK